MNGKQDSAAPAAVLHVPVTTGAVVLSYNLADVKDTLMLSLACWRISSWARSPNERCEDRRYQ